MTEKGKIIFELIKSVNAGAANTLPFDLIVDKAINEYNELVKRGIIEPHYEHNDPQSWEENLRMLDNIMCNS